MTRSEVTADPYENYRSTRFFGSLDGLRAFAIIAVIWFHTGAEVSFARFLNEGHLGVPLFFTLSGFLITTLLLRERDRHGSVSLGKFYMRRSLRIFPLYYTIIFLYIVAVVAVEGQSQVGKEFWSNLPAFLTYTSNWFVELEADRRVIFYFAWSLAAEEQFYLVWPSIERWLKGWGPVIVAGFIIVVNQVVVGAAKGGHVDPDSLWVVIVSSIPPPILIGVITAHMLHYRLSFDWMYKITGAVWSAPVYLAGLLLTIEYYPRKELVWIFMALLVVSCACRESNGLARFARVRLVAHIGVISYGMYLMHMLSYNVIKRVLAPIDLNTPFVRFVVTMVLVTVVASISYKYYESIFLKIKERFSRVPTRHPVDEEETRPDAATAPD